MSTEEALGLMVKGRMNSCGGKKERKKERKSSENKGKDDQAALGTQPTPRMLST